MNLAVNEYPRSIARKLAIEARYFAEISPASCDEAVRGIEAYLIQLGITFEGRRLPISLRPTIVSRDEVERTAADLLIIKNCLNKLLNKLVADIQANEENYLTKFFAFYKPWFQLIAGEVRKNEHIMLMRYDAAAGQDGVHKVMEPNGACPGGVIHCAYIRQAWLNSELARSIVDGIALTEFECDSPDGFINHLFDAAGPVPDPVVAVCNYKGVFTNELASLCRRNEKLAAEGLARGKIIACDIRDITMRGEEAFVGQTRIDVIYNKIDHMMVNPSDPDIQGWVSASRSERCEFLNSIAALFIAEAKSIFAAMWDHQAQQVLDFSPEEISVISSRIPRTRMLVGHRDSPTYGDLTKNRAKYVVKADALTRGAGVYVGVLEDEDSWGTALLKLASANAVVQELIDIPIRDTVHFGERTEPSPGLCREFYGIDYFFFGQRFGGVVSRCHSSMIFNVGSGGQEVPTLVVS